MKKLASESSADDTNCADNADVEVPVEDVADVDVPVEDDDDSIDRDAAVPALSIADDADDVNPEVPETSDLPKDPDADNDAADETIPYQLDEV